jgi:enoyl-CoA hydratase
MHYKNIRVTQLGAVTSISIDRLPRKNSVDIIAAGELAHAFRAFDADANASVAILSGEGGTFCAGADLKSLAAGEKDRITVHGDGPMGPTRMQLSKPVIAAIEGYAVAGGLELAVWADMRVVAEDAVLGVFCRRFGVPLVDLGTVRLPRLIGHSRAMDLILTGREVGAAEALQMGLANRVVPKGEAFAAALKLAQDLCALPQRCMRNDRISALKQWELSWDEATTYETTIGLQTLGSGETLAGAQKFSDGAGRHGKRLS